MPAYPMFYGKSVTYILSRFRKIFFKIWESCISIWLHIDYGKDNLLSFSILKKLFIYLRSSADKCLFCIFCEKGDFQIIDRMKNTYSLMRKIPSSKYDIFSPWKDSSDRLKSLSSHNDRISRRSLSKMLKILRNMPGNFSFISYDTITSHSSDGNIFNFHTKKYSFFSRECKNSTKKTEDIINIIYIYGSYSPLSSISFIHSSMTSLSFCIWFLSSSNPENFRFSRILKRGSIDIISPQISSSNPKKCASNNSKSRKYTPTQQNDFPPTIAESPYVPSSRFVHSHGSDILAVGNPIVRPSFFPSMTIPEIMEYKIKN